MFFFTYKELKSQLWLDAEVRYAVIRKYANRDRKTRKDVCCDRKCGKCRIKVLSSPNFEKREMEALQDPRIISGPIYREMECY